jgi:hypothetical protein
MGKSHNKTATQKAKSPKKKASTVQAESSSAKKLTPTQKAPAEKKGK